jgi:hypothetical protein
MDKSLRNAIIVGITIVALSIAYYLVIFLPKSEKNNTKQAAISEEVKSNDEQKPSERALSAAAGVYVKFISNSENNKKVFFEKYSSKEENVKLAIQNYALFLDGNIDTLVLTENTLAENDSKSSSNDKVFVPLQTPQSYEVDNTESALEKFNRESEQKCQKDINEYNSCMIEYNSKMTEYNACISESSNPKSYRYNGYCYKPSNFCYKPICAY